MKEIYLKNSLTKKKELFKPEKEGVMSMYNCGPTVYNRSHIGNLRSYIFADTIKRVFEFNNYKVNQVVNITDVGHLTSNQDEGEDKIEKEANKENISAILITQKYTEYFLKDLKKLNIDTEKIIFPKATENIKEQIDLIKILENKGLTYKTKDGIYFDTSKIDYGKLFKIQNNQNKLESRIQKISGKRNAHDFALWKFSPEDSKRQQEWPSPWGVGFPGWHIECSAMSIKYLGQPFDIHTGGIDHLPVHHNNEIAQSESAFDKPLANYWLHHNHIMINGEKMSKSLGNTLLLDDLEKMNINPNIFRYWILTSHYSTLINFTDESINSAKIAFQKIINYFENTKIKTDSKIEQNYMKEMIETINDDFDTAGLVAIVWNLIKDNNIEKEDKLKTILEIDKILGLNIEKEIKNAGKDALNIDPEIIKLAEERQKERAGKNFQKSDELRKVIEKSGYQIKDTDDGFELKKAQ